MRNTCYVWNHFQVQTTAKALAETREKLIEEEKKKKMKESSRFHLFCYFFKNKKDFKKDYKIKCLMLTQIALFSVYAKLWSEIGLTSQKLETFVRKLWANCIAPDFSGRTSPKKYFEVKLLKPIFKLCFFNLAFCHHWISNLIYPLDRLSLNIDHMFITYCWLAIFVWGTWRFFVYWMVSRCILVICKTTVWLFILWTTIGITAFCPIGHLRPFEKSNLTLYLYIKYSRNLRTLVTLQA